jgi:molybdopterin-dependent oxidoreductase alpha subunit
MPPKTPVIVEPGPAGGWGSVGGMAKVAWREHTDPSTLKTLMEQNRPHGFACVSCAWTKPAEAKLFEFCENGAKATLWETTPLRCTPEFFAEHTVTELRTWKDFDLEQQGRLTHPLRYDPATDKYVPCAWEDAFAAIGAELRALAPRSVVFYTSGRASLETSYCYALLARLFGCNNLPDSSNMCHETTSVALQEVIGAAAGTTIYADYAKCDAMFFFGQNPGSNSPRFLHPIQDAVERGAKVVTFNPIRERGLIEFIDPQHPGEMITGRATQISCQYHQVTAGGDIAAMTGMCKHLFALDDAAQAEQRARVLDVDFIEHHTNGFDSFERFVRNTDWADIERDSGLAQGAIEQAADVYAEAERVIGVYGMGLTQHARGFDNVTMLVNLLLLRGNIGREGTGVSPIRGHSNVQGQRTVGISEKPELVPLDKIAEMFGFEPPREKGLTTVEVCQGVLDGTVKAFIGLGGNFLRAIPEQRAVEEAWPSMKLTVQIATKLNRSHLVNGATAFLLPCLGRTEEDLQAGGAQLVTVEDSLSHIHASAGRRTPASAHLRSEMAIVAGIAKATLPTNPKVDWDRWVGNYATVRDLIEETYPELFRDFNGRLFTPGGFYKGNAARERIWKTGSGRAAFTVPGALQATGFEAAPDRFRLITMRSNDQFNTTIYGHSDRLRGIEDSRDVLLINRGDMARAGLRAGDIVTLTTDTEDGVHREVGGLTVVPFDLPDGCVGAYYPEVNPLVPLGHHDFASKTPAYKSVPVRLHKQSSPTS